MSAETMFWLGFILVSPAFYTLGRLTYKLVIEPFMPDEKVVVSYRDAQGVEHSTTISISNDDDLQQILNDIKHGSPRNRGPAH